MFEKLAMRWPEEESFLIARDWFLDHPEHNHYDTIHDEILRRSMLKITLTTARDSIEAYKIMNNLGKVGLN